jgi:hypothetical protein
MTARKLRRNNRILCIFGGGAAPNHSAKLNVIPNRHTSSQDQKMSGKLV